MSGVGATVTDLVHLRDAYLRELDATVTAVEPEARRVALDRTVFYATGGGQPHDTGTHVRSTAEVGRVAVVKTESKGKGNKRIRLEVRNS